MSNSKYLRRSRESTSLFGLFMKKKIEWIVLIIYIIMKIIIMYYHEPWFDELQAWKIARSVSVFELVTNVTHREGHPPLWYLLLMPIAKSGISVEIGLKSVTLVLTSISVGLLIFKAPFKRIIRIMLPFTYFFFYQYGVLSRPYSLMMLGFVLSAITYKKRNEKPLLFILSLGILCGSSAFGILIAAGICIVWFFEIWNKQNVFKFIVNFVKDKRFWCFVGLCMVNLFFVYTIIPFKDTYALTLGKGALFSISLIKMIFVEPFNSICMDSDINKFIILSKNTMNINYLLSFPLILGITLIIIWTRKYKKTALLVIPYLLFAVFAAKVYFARHHQGIIIMFLVFVAWCCMESGKGHRNNRKSLKVFSTIDSVVIPLVVAVILIIPITWSIKSSINDIKNEYGYGRNLANFIKENNLENCNILAEWPAVTINNGAGRLDYVNHTCDTDCTAYFKHNIIYNYNNGKDSEGYTKLNIMNEKKNLEIIHSWKRKGYPEVVLGGANLAIIFQGDPNIPDYVPVYKYKFRGVWKDKLDEQFTGYVFVRKDFMKINTNLKEIKDDVHVIRG